MEITPELAELFGAYVGDGTMSRLTKGTTLMSIYGSKEAKGWLEHLASLFEKSFYHRPKVRWCTKAYAIRIGISKICKFFQSAGFPIGKKTHNVRAPAAITNCDEKSIFRAFLMGYFDADGSLGFQKRKYGGYSKFKTTYHYYPRIYLESASRDLIYTDIKSMLLDLFNLRYRVYDRTRCAGKYLAHAAVIKGATQLELWMAKIGSSNPVHLTKYLVWKKFGFCPPRTTLNQRLAILSGELDPRIFYEGR